MTAAPFIIGGIAAVTVIVIEIRRALQPGSAVREIMGAPFE